MKRLLAICLCLLTLPLTALADGVTDRENRMWAWVDALLPEQTDLGPGDYDHNQIVGDPDNGWNFSIVLKEHPEDNNGLLVYHLTPAGELMLTESPMTLTLNQQAHAAILACRGEGHYMELAQVVLDWAGRLDLLDWSRPEDVRHSDITDILKLDVRFPEEGTISYEEALAAAKEYLLAQPGWTEETLTHFMETFSMYTVPEDIGRPVWLFVFHKASNTPETQAMSSKAYSEYLDKLYSYTINGEEEPVEFSVLIDAADGSLAEAPRYDYRPVKYIWTDFLVRPENFLNDND